MSSKIRKANKDLEDRDNYRERNRGRGKESIKLSKFGNDALQST